MNKFTQLQDDLGCTLEINETLQKVIAPTPHGGVGVVNSIPRVIGHTDTGYAFVFENNLINKRYYILKIIFYIFISLFYAVLSNISNAVTLVLLNLERKQSTPCPKLGLIGCTLKVMYAH